MIASPKIQATHLERQAVVYLRQSSPKQVIQNRESTSNQRALAERLHELGWRKQQITVIDEDQGISAAYASGRKGFQKLVADVGLRKIGIIMGYEVSRISRNCADWHQLLELCGVFDTLLADTDGIYHPRDFNDRLILGLKGTMSEAELHSLRLRLEAGRVSKAKRGELIQHLPTGYIRMPDGNVSFEPDISVQARIRLVFEKFFALGTIQKTLRYFVQHELKVPRRQTSGLYAGKILWREPVGYTFASILKNPAYAGAFAYGRRTVDRTKQVPGRPATGRPRKPPSQWIALVRDVYPAYITWQQHELIQSQIAENCQKMQQRMTRKRALRGGAALLTGLVRCAFCGHAMSVGYRERENRYQYACHAGYNKYGKSSCQCVSGRPIDEAVTEEFFRVLEPSQIDALEAVHAKQAEHHRELIMHLEQEVQRLDYEAQRAHRQYDCVDPENRLIAATLEKNWEHALEELQQAKTKLAETRQAASPLPNIPKELRKAFADAGKRLPEIWAGLTNEAKKSLLRTIVTGVNLRRGDDGTLQIRIVWRGGLVTERVIRVRCFTLRGSEAEKKLATRIRQFYDEGLNDSRIADRLNEEGFMPCRADGFTPIVVNKTRRRYAIVSNYHKARQGNLDCGYTIQEMAAIINIHPSWIYRKIQRGEMTIQKNERFGCYLFPRNPNSIEQIRQLKNKEVRHVSVPEVH